VMDHTWNRSTDSGSRVRAILQIAVLSTALAVSGCVSPPTAAEKQETCPRLAIEREADLVTFESKSSLHKAFNNDLTSQLLDAQLRTPQLPGETTAQRATRAMMTVCVPLHGEAKCAPVVQDYIAYADRSIERLAAGVRHDCKMFS
jgi:hypothetical protein